MCAGQNATLKFHHGRLCGAQAWEYTETTAGWRMGSAPPWLTYSSQESYSLHEPTEGCITLLLYHYMPPIYSSM